MGKLFVSFSLVTLFLFGSYAKAADKVVVIPLNSSSVVPERAQSIAWGVLILMVG